MNQAEAPPRRRPLSCALVLLLVLALVLGGLYALDRVVLARTTAELETQVRTALPEVSGDLTIDIGGVLFLPQVLRGTIGSARVTASSAQVDTFAVEDVQVELTDVATTEPYTAGSLVIEGFAPAQTLQQAVATAGVPEEVTITVDDGELLAVASVLGVGIEVVLDVEPRPGAIAVSVGAVTFGGAQVDVDTLPATITSGLSNLEVPLDDLPEGLELTGVDVRQDRVFLQVTGTDVVFEDL